MRTAKPPDASGPNDAIQPLGRKPRLRAAPDDELLMIPGSQRNDSATLQSHAEAPLTAPPISALSPFRFPVFRAVWAASLVSNLGGLIQSVGASWMMTSI